MSNLQKSKRFYLIDKLSDTSRYLDDIFIIDDSELEKRIPDIYTAQLRLHKANTSDIETSFLDLNIKVLLEIIFTPAFTTNENIMTLNFLSLIPICWAVMFLNSHRTVFKNIS